MYMITSSSFYTASVKKNMVEAKNITNTDTAKKHLFTQLNYLIKNKWTGNSRYLVQDPEFNS